ncbi:MAG: hypothetical protein COV10_02925 [Candidatus Vogelbacteria bacterium CG10_big_fil_rev_8_21_14_0_10_51_16]|uniref:UDP-N-acetylglucosamine--N-acetylmuramyl-(pentapeptide) pyrophosphoryl-undecaprenol N-acetylglucosamine transferase n=1 Tax=Candidatus Vogelbacteria bacterium CG10_big_fil_rev_8_21_14_0_10_51_16 TaxID=1975045 RepID=A0A2H0RE36_9BACT|nr:MAG: hypothetical protein COV10_02925 [Candidatus Vogelbacteria bacterium CG10_big_fil_rev_8_21_14_0_10_51_16]
MKILFTGGGSGGHFYPIIAVAEALQEKAEEEKYVGIELYYMSDSPYNKRALFEAHLTYIHTTAGRSRTYLSIRNISDSLKTVFGLITSTWKLYTLFPDVIFAKGGYASFPALFAAKLLQIPVVIHESDSVPGRVNRWAGKFARYVAVSYAEAETFFPKEKVAVTGNPVRSALIDLSASGAREFFGAEAGVPIIYITGGSQGAMTINNMIVDMLPQLVEKYTVVHQIGALNLGDVKSRAALVLGQSSNKDRYKPFGYLDMSATRMIGACANIIISRAGSTIFEIAAWGTPSILIPLSGEIAHGDHQRANAYNYAHSGAAIVIEEKNLGPHLLASEIDRILGSVAIQEEMRLGARKFFKPDAAKIIAEALLNIGLEHE